MGSIDLNPDQFELVKNILKTTLPHIAKVWVFGSRATGKAKPFSDLDLAIDAGQKLSQSDYSDLSEAFENSVLPYKVDLVDMHNVSELFKNIIDTSKVDFGFL